MGGLRSGQSGHICGMTDYDSEYERSGEDPPAPTSEDREGVADTTGMTDPDDADADDAGDHPGGSGTAGPATDEKRQAGSYARDAEQDPAADRHARSDSDG